MKRRRPTVFLAMFFLSLTDVRAATITTPEILSKTAAATIACMQWTPVGLCLWLDCSFFGCQVKASLKIGHYNPDLVVSSYNELGGNPWREIRATLGLAQKAAARGVLGSLVPVPIESAGNRTEGSTRNLDHKNLLFRETDAIGHPQQFLSGFFAGLNCKSQTRPFMPYFQSGIDALSWRQEVPEMFYPASFIPGLREFDARLSGVGASRLEL